MRQIIRGKAHNIIFDEPLSRFFIIGGSVWVYDLRTNEKIGRLKDIHYPTCVGISHKNNILFVQSTDGHFGFYTADTLEFLGKLTIRYVSSTDNDFYYDEQDNVICGIRTISCHPRYPNETIGFELVEIMPKQCAYTAIHLPQLEFSKEKEVEGHSYTMYRFCKYDGKSYYIIRNFRNWSDESGLPTYYDSCYGRFEKEGNSLILKERIFETNERMLEFVDVAERTDAPRIHELFEKLSQKGTPAYLWRTYRNERGLFAITERAVYRMLPGGEIEEVAREEYMSDYKEYNGKKYICTWDHCIIEDIEDNNHIVNL